ncbi:MAG: response regulator [Saprospiraceae bacterium]|nr:response regulator [Saprospiraceae bacterium]
MKIDTASLEVEEIPISRVRNFLYHKGLIWYTNETDLLLNLDPETGKSTSVFKQFFPKGTYGTTYLHDLKLGKKSGNLLICSSEGLHEYNSETGKLRTFRTDNPLGENLPTHHILTVFEDESGTWWLGTNDHGLVKFNAATGETQAYDTKSGLCNNRVVSILPDAQGRLWLGTFNGLSCFNPKEQLFENFYKSDGLFDTEFNRLSAYQSYDGRMFFGTVNGVNIFHPDDALSARANKGTFPVVSTVEFFDKKQGAVTINCWDGSPIRLGADNRRIRVKIAAAYPSFGKQVNFAYLLEGFTDNWVHLPDGQHQIQFEYLPAGHFMLRVKCTNGMGEWSKKELVVPIRVQAFFYQTWWFFLLVLGILSFSVFWFYRLHSKQKLASQRAADLEELDTLKSRLYTSITHEFRTPLTLILGPVQALLRRAGTVSTGELVSNLTHVQNNGQRLLGLINQILDLQKLEAGQMQPHYEQGDIMTLLQYLTDSFHSMAASKHLHLGFTGHPKPFLMDFDKDKLTKIVVNLLTNAIKFTPEGGEVRLTAKGEASFWLEVRDKGIGIRQENLDNIFDLFYQVDNSSTRRGEGTGIGLTLVKELTELMGGHISVSSEEGKGTCFRIELPVRNEAPLNVTLVPGIEMQNLEATATSSFLPSENTLSGTAPLVLVVEDNPDVSAYIGSCLGSEYRIEYASDGKAGMGKAVELVPDLVISDVMMPEADGFEVCRFLKNDDRTSHIPVILLTARAEIQDKLEGLRQGADAYLAKPFYEEELLITVEKLLRLRQTLWERFGNLSANLMDGTQNHSTSQVNDSSFDLPKEDAFMEQVMEVIRHNLEHSAFSVEQLTREMGMSNTQLFRKLKALTDLSANQLIRRVRLERAKELLKHTDLTVAEIAYQTGFTDPSYFTRIFVREVGVQPSEFRRV